jgi:hypothetical protein
MKKFRITKKSCQRFSKEIHPSSIAVFKISIVLIVFFISSGLLLAEERPERKASIVIYNFRMLKPSAEKTAKYKKPKDYSYYSIILPETIYKRLSESDRFSTTEVKNSFLITKLLQ